MQVRFLAKSFFAGRIVEPGEEIEVPGDTRLGQHMVRLDGENDHLADPQPFVGRFRADLAYFPDPEELRAQMTEEARQRAEATRAREAEEERQRVETSVGEQPRVEGVSPQDQPNPDQGSGAADG